MPTVFRHRGYAFRIYTNDHPPPHVHIVSAEGRAIVDLRNWTVTRAAGIPKSVLRELVLRAADESGRLIDAWEKMRGSTGNDIQTH